MQDKSEAGIALIAVLWTLIVLSVVAATVSLETRTSVRIVRNLTDNAVARAAADAGIQRAILDFMTPAAHKKFRANGTVYEWQFAGCNVRISLQSERDKVNLNAAPETLLVSLFGSVGIDPDKAKSLADAIVDFRDADSFRHPHGAEESDYRTAALVWSPKNTDFETVEELQQVLGVTAAIYELVAPRLTIYSTEAAIYPTKAGERLTEILRSAGINRPLFVPRIAYSIRAEAKSSNGGVFVREAVVQLPKTSLPRILSWR
jgi:general secretion pathway protein K